MNQNRLLVFLFSLLLALGTFGCATYKPAPLPNLQPEFAPYSETIDNVTLSCKTLSKAECKKYFDRDIIDKGYQPVQLSIKNATKKYILFSNQGISLPVSSPEEVAEKCHTSTVGRATGYGVAGLFVWPLLIPAVVDGISSSQANTNLDRDFSEKNIEQIIINPFATHSGIIFIANNYFQDSFSVRLVDKETKEKFEYSVRGLKGHYTGSIQSSEKSEK
jgi:hypothetical protein